MDPKALIQALHDPAAYPVRPDQVEVIETHISAVFLAGEDVYKLKKPVNLGFLDFSTLERRKHFCEEELRLNRRLAPETYLGVVPITSQGSSVRIGGEGEPIDYAVHMRRLPEERMLDKALAAEQVTETDIDAIAQKLAAFHAAAASGQGVDEHASSDSVRKAIMRNLDECKAVADPRFRTSVFSEALIDCSRHVADQSLMKLAPLINSRFAAGKARDGHGDLHCANICLAEGGPVIYDCLEFDPALRCGDVARECAFLAMDLEARGHARLADRFLSRYSEHAGDHQLRELVSLFAAHFAIVRGKVTLLRSGADRDPDLQRRANRYFLYAARRCMRPMLVLTCGLPGSGKSHLARQIGSALGIDSTIRSDVVRKQLLGLSPTEHYRGPIDEGPYSPEQTQRTYAALLDHARPAFDGTRSVIVDAAFSRADQREPFIDAAARAGIPFAVIHITADDAEVRRRLEQRRNDPREVSDAGLDVYLKAKAAFEPPREVPAASLIEHASGSPPEPAIRRIIELACS